MRTKRHGLSSFFGAVAAWLCLAPVAFARAPLSLLSAHSPASNPAHQVGSFLFVIWITGGIFFALGGLLAIAPFRFRACKSDPSSDRAQFGGSALIDLAWTVIPVLVVVAQFLGTVRVISQ